jgi:hypothetical protein
MLGMHQGICIIINSMLLIECTQNYDISVMYMLCSFGGVILMGVMGVKQYDIESQHGRT